MVSQTYCFVWVKVLTVTVLTAIIVDFYKEIKKIINIKKSPYTVFVYWVIHYYHVNNVKCIM